MSGDPSEDERVALAALADDLDVLKCDTPECKSPAAFSIVVHGKGERHGCNFRCASCYTQYLFHNQKTMSYSGALRCVLCNEIFRTLDDWWEIRKV